MAEFIKIPEFKYKGIKRIEIPKVDDDFRGTDLGEAIIRKYLPEILSTHQKNAAKINFLYNYYLGMQDILNKERLYSKDSDNNNIVVENHAYRQVNFKVGFLTGEKREYTHKADTDTDDLIFLDRYFTNVKFFSKDTDLKDWIYATGIGCTYTAPRTDIIFTDANGVTRYKTANEGFDVNFDAPFTFSTINPTENFVVYSSRFDKNPLFCVSVVEVDVGNSETVEKRKELHIETRYASFLIQSDLSYSTFYFPDNDRMIGKPKTLNYLPIIEYSTNAERMGIVELNRELFNSINTLKSSTEDMIVDNANAIMVFKNVDISADDVQKMKEAGAIIISDAESSKPGSTADLKTITIEIPFEGLSTYYDQTLQQCYDIAGVPLASGAVTSGGDTGQARLLGGGWNNAYIIINKDINSLLRYDYEELELILLLCKQVPNCPVDKLHASQVDIKYRINQNDNFLVKAQGIQNLYNVNMPKDEILKASGLFNDITTVSKKWELLDKEIREKEETKEVSTPSGNDNNSQE